MIRTFEVEENYLDDNDPWAGILTATAFAIRSTAVCFKNEVVKRS